MVTTPMNFEGVMDRDNRVCTMFASGKGPDGKPAKYKSETTTVDKDHHTFKLSSVDGTDKETLMMTIEYTRKK